MKAFIILFISLASIAHASSLPLGNRCIKENTLLSEGYASKIPTGETSIRIGEATAYAFRRSCSASGCGDWINYHDKFVVGNNFGYTNNHFYTISGNAVQFSIALTESKEPSLKIVWDTPKTTYQIKKTGERDRTVTVYPAADSSIVSRDGTVSFDSISVHEVSNLGTEGIRSLYLGEGWAGPYQWRTYFTPVYLKGYITKKDCIFFSQLYSTEESSGTYSEHYIVVTNHGLVKK